MPALVVVDRGGDVVVDPVGADDVDGAVALQHIHHVGLHAGEVEVDVPVPAGAASLAAIALGDERTARVALRAAHRPMDAVATAMPMDATHARLILARAALALGEPEIARGYLRDARPVIDSISDVGVMRQQHTELMAQLDALDPGVDGDPDEEFTDRELEVLAMLPSPLSAREIAEELFVSRNTIKTHVRRVYRKLNASSREEAVLIARDRGLLRAQDDRLPLS